MRFERANQRSRIAKSRRARRPPRLPRPQRRGRGGAALPAAPPRRPRLPPRSRWRSTDSTSARYGTRSERASPAKACVGRRTGETTSGSTACCTAVAEDLWREGHAIGSGCLRVRARRSGISRRNPRSRISGCGSSSEPRSSSSARPLVVVRRGSTPARASRSGQRSPVDPVVDAVVHAGIGSGSTSRPSTSTVGEPRTRYDSASESDSTSTTSISAGMPVSSTTRSTTTRAIPRCGQSSRARISIRTDPFDFFLVTSAPLPRVSVGFPFP